MNIGNQILNIRKENQLKIFLQVQEQELLHRVYFPRIHR